MRLSVAIWRWDHNHLYDAFAPQVNGGGGIRVAHDNISLFFFAVGILYQLLVFFAIQVRQRCRCSG